MWICDPLPCPPALAVASLSPAEALVLFLAHCDMVVRRHRHLDFPEVAAPHAVDPAACAPVRAWGLGRGACPKAETASWPSEQ